MHSGMLMLGMSLSTTPMPAQPGLPRGCGSPARIASLADRTEGDPVTTFDSAWTLIQRTHYDTTFNGVDWEQVRRDLRPQAAAARTTGEVRRVLGDMIGRLRQSHFAIIPQETVAGVQTIDSSRPNGDPGFDVRLIGGRVVVAAVTTGSSAAQLGVRPGWTLMRIDGCPVDIRSTEPDARARGVTVYQGVQQAMAGPVGDTLQLDFLDARDRPTTRRVARVPMDGTITKFGNLPPMAVSLTSQRVTQDGRTIGIIRFNLWMPALARSLDEAVDGLRDTDGIVLDLRGNLGGVGGMAMGLAGHFLDSALSLGTMQQRHNALRFVANPRRVDTRARPVRPYGGALAIVIDGLSVSTSEIFAKGMQALGRARVFGEQTPGQALPAIPERLPNGDILYHAVADFRSPRGERIEGDGVVPDAHVPLTRRALLAGQDASMDAAIRWAATRATAPRKSP